MKNEAKLGWLRQGAVGIGMFILGWALAMWNQPSSRPAPAVPSNAADGGAIPEFHLRPVWNTEAKTLEVSITLPLPDGMTQEQSFEWKIGKDFYGYTVKRGLNLSSGGFSMPKIKRPWDLPDEDPEE